MRKRLYLRIILATGLSLCLLLKIDWQNIVITNPVWGYLPLIITVLLCVYVARAKCYKVTIDAAHLSVFQLFLVTGIYNFASTVFPFSLGHLSYPYLLRKYHSVPVHKSMSNLILYNSIRVVMLLVVFILAVFRLNLLESITLSIPKLSLILIPVAILMLVVIKRLKVFQSNIFVNKIGKLLSDINSELKQNIGKGKLYRFIVYLFVVVFLNILTTYYCYRFIGYSLSIMEILLIFSIVNLSSILPVHGIGSLGSYEVINTLVLVLIGFSGNEAIQMSFAVHFVRLLVQGIIALGCYLYIVKFRDKPARP